MIDVLLVALAAFWLGVLVGQYSMIKQIREVLLKLPLICNLKR